MGQMPFPPVNHVKALKECKVLNLTKKNRSVPGCCKKGCCLLYTDSFSGHFQVCLCDQLASEGHAAALLLAFRP